MKNTEESRIDQIKDDLKQEALLFRGRARLAAMDLVDKLESAFSIASGNLESEDEYLAALVREAGRAYRQQAHLLAFVERVQQDSHPMAEERITLLSETLQKHISELEGEFRELDSPISQHQESVADKYSKFRGTLEGALSHPDFEWSLFKVILDEIQEISGTYLLIHALALGQDRTLAAGMAWNHLRRIEVHSTEISSLVYHMVIGRVCDGKPVEPVVDQGIEEWKQSIELSLRHASREIVDTVVD